jgi:outer membrane immunogenic protein
VKAPPPPAPVYDWTGFYLGGFYGNSLSQSQASTPAPGLPVGTHSGAVDINSIGWSGGGEAGYNWQFAPTWLVGVEGDFGYFGGNRLSKEWDDAIADGEKNSWYATLRGRIGYVTGPSLLYVTGGVGFVHVTDTFGGTAVIAPTASATTTTGGTIGAGIETKLSRNWSTKTEYLYIDGGHHSFASNSEGIVGTPTTFSHSFQVIKTGLNYRFDGNWDGLPFFNTTLLASNHNWNGFYVGGNAGIGASLTQTHAVATTTGNADLNGNGFAGGGEAGYNYMLWNKYLVGLEGDFGALTTNHQVNDWFDTGLAMFSQKTNWYGTMRARLGTTTGPALLYITGGAAWVNLQDGYQPQGAFAGQLISRTASGWTVGGGTEVALDAHWSAKLESLFIRTGSTTAAVFPTTLTTSFKDQFMVVRAGLDYAFN